MLSGFVIGIGSHIFITKELKHNMRTKKYWIWFIPLVLGLNALVQIVLSFLPVVHR